MLELGADKSAGPPLIAGLLIAKISDRLCRTRPSLRGQPCLAYGPLRDTQKAVTTPVAQEANPRANQATRAILGPGRPLSVVGSSTLRGLRRRPAGQAVVRA
jgi:hypothetical protein